MTLFGYPLPSIKDGSLHFYLWDPPYDGGWIWFKWPREAKKFYCGRKKEDGAIYWCFLGFCGLVHFPYKRN